MLIATQRLSFISADGLQNCSLKSKGTSTGGSSAAAAVRRSGSKQICPRKAASSSSSGECSATGSMLSADSRGGGSPLPIGSALSLIEASTVSGLGRN